MTRRFTRPLALAAGALALAAGAAAAQQPPAVYQLPRSQYTPPVSTYLNIIRRNGGLPAATYFNFTQPTTLPDLPLIPSGPSPTVRSTAFQPAASLDVPAPPPAGTGWQPTAPRPTPGATGGRPVFLTLTGPKPQPQAQPKGMLTRFGD